RREVTLTQPTESITPSRKLGGSPRRCRCDDPGLKPNARTSVTGLERGRLPRSHLVEPGSRTPVCLKMDTAIDGRSHRYRHAAGDAQSTPARRIAFSARRDVDRAWRQFRAVLCQRTQGRTVLF